MQHHFQLSVATHGPHVSVQLIVSVSTARYKYYCRSVNSRSRYSLSFPALGDKLVKIMASRYLAAAAAALLLYSTASAQDLDIAAVAAAGPPPSPSIATNVPSQTVVYDSDSAQQSAAAQQSASPATPASKVKRAACDPQVMGNGPVPSPDTDDAFVSYSSFSSAALAAPTPFGYVNTFKNLKAENNALGYMGYTLLDAYDTIDCSKKCDAINGCSAFK